jgi:hypothetical protein
VWPNLSSYLQFDAPGGHTFIITGTVADTQDTVFEDGDDFGWAVQAGANINLADIATLTVGGLYGEGGQHCQYLAQDTPFCGEVLDIDKGGVDDFFSEKGWGVLAGLSFGITDTTTFNVQYGISVMDNDVEFIEGHNDVLVQTVHANILWRPVQQMQLGWEVMWGQYDIDSDDDFFVGRTDDDAIRAQFGAWFFF